MLTPPGVIIEFVLDSRQMEDQVNQDLCRDNPTLEQAREQVEYENCDEDVIPVIPADFGTNGLIELSKICRCCLAKKNNLQSIFDANSCIPEMIMSLATVEVSYKSFHIFNHY